MEDWGRGRGVTVPGWGGVSKVRVRVYVGNVFLTLSPHCSSASWSRAMIFWMNSSKKQEQRGCSHLSAEKSFSVVSLHFLKC